MGLLFLQTVLGIMDNSVQCWINLVKMKIRNLQSLLVCPIILWRSLTRTNEFLADGPDWHLWSWTGVWLSLITSGNFCSDTLELHGFNSCGQSAEEDAVGFAKKRYPIFHVCPKYLAAHCCGSAVPENGLAFHQDLDEVGKTLVDW